ncbi:MAG: glycoside hydrolase family 16 protein, partial [Planctomycetaceae bacterium]|nr:glycoside hydrolase family 16 protein [Planctomycetaceae bacterium]
MASVMCVAEVGMCAVENFSDKKEKMKVHLLTMLATIILLSVEITVLNAEEKKSAMDETSVVVVSPDSKLPPAKEAQSEWRLVWEENFDGNVIDLKRWSKIPRGGPDWAKHMSDFGGCYEVKGGQLILRGLRNEHLPDDKSPYLTGGIYTKGKVNFSDGRVEVRAKLGNAQGAWPAFWMLPSDNTGWPRGGEIDIMERLNSDDFAYHTVHSHYTHTLKMKTPPQGATGKIIPNDYNVYAVEMNKDYLSFFINGKHNLTYPRIETDKEGQFPFDREFYLLLDMQLGGSWVGEIKPDDLPVEMWIDWVRFYKKD